MLPTKFRFIWPSGFRGEDFKKSANQKQESPVAEGFQRRRLKCEKLTVMAKANIVFGKVS